MLAESHFYFNKAADVLDLSDKAMYLAKERHDTYVVFDSSMRSGQKLDADDYYTEE